MVVQVNQRSPVIASTANLFTFPTHPLHLHPRTRLPRTRLPYYYCAFSKRHNGLAYLPDLTDFLDGDPNGSNGSNDR
jgi:hypothetical protein